MGILDQRFLGNVKMMIVIFKVWERNFDRFDKYFFDRGEVFYLGFVFNKSQRLEVQEFICQLGVGLVGKIF